MDTISEQHTHQNQSGGYPPKPVVVEKNQTSVFRSLISLFIYGLLFYFLFEQNLAYIAAILLVIIIHEMGHFAFMRLFNYRDVKIFIMPLLGAFTAGKKQQVSQTQLSVIILAGPVPGIIIGSILFWLNKDAQNETVKMLANTFLVINLLNCLPFYPLDGGRLVETLFFKENFAIRLAFGIVSIMALLIMAAIFSSFVLLIIPALIAYELYNENKNQKIRNYLAQEKINYRLEYNTLPDKDYWLMRDCLLFSFPKKYPGIAPGNYQYSIIEPIFVRHVSSLLQTNLVPDLNVIKKILVLIFYLAVFIAPIVMVAMNWQFFVA